MFMIKNIFILGASVFSLSSASYSMDNQQQTITPPVISPGQQEVVAPPVVTPPVAPVTVDPVAPVTTDPVVPKVKKSILKRIKAFLGKIMPCIQSTEAVVTEVATDITTVVADVDTVVTDVKKDKASKSRAA